MDTAAMLSVYLKERRITMTEFGRMINKNSITATNYTKNNGINTEVLMTICVALQHNFYQDIANSLPLDYTVVDDATVGRGAIIAQLTEENKRLKIENELLLKIKG